MTARSLAKDFHRLQKNISSFSNDEARVVDVQDDLTRFDVELNIKDGFYKDGLFLVEVSPLNYPHQAPGVTFKTSIFHPNIGDGYDHGTVCFNLFDEEWTESNDLETVVQGLLFLVKNPNVTDPLNPLFDPESGHFDEDDEVCIADFECNVRKSLEGGEVEGFVFQRNPGLGPEICGVTELDKAPQEKSELTGESAEKESEKRGIESSTVDPNEVNDLVLTTPEDLAMVSVFSEKVFRDEWNPYVIFEHHGLLAKIGDGVQRGGLLRAHCDGWLLRLLTVLKASRTNSKEGAVNVRTASNLLWNFKPIINYLQRALTRNER